MFNIFKKKKKKIGLCLGGGGTRGFGHLGAIKAFEEYGIKFDMVAGTSVGSIVGVMYSAEMTFQEIYNISKSIVPKDIKKSKFGFMPSSTEGLQNFLKSFMKYEKIEDLPIKFWAVAVDLKTGMEYNFEHGDLAPIVAGSCAVPAIFTPVQYKNYNLIDGGVLNNIPANVLKEDGCDIVITVDVNSSRGSGTASSKTLDTIMASFSIMMKNNSKNGYTYSDIVIQPNIKKYKSTKLDGADEMIQEGYNATIKAMPQIIEIIGKKK
ncbi:MAG: patatin-like phospholipase family protein [Clostridia bacterium]|nr:patatin-like phospholipase family protein [Clostridia bacterium]